MGEEDHRHGNLIVLPDSELLGAVNISGTYLLCECRLNKTTLIDGLRTTLKYPNRYNNAVYMAVRELDVSIRTVERPGGNKVVTAPERPGGEIRITASGHKETGWKINRGPGCEI